MEQLTLKQKQIIMATIYFESEFNRHIKEDAYGESPAWRMLDTWISQILNLDFRTDVYNNNAVQDLNSIETVKTQFRSQYSQWFVGDAIRDIIYKQIFAKDGVENSPSQIDVLEANVRGCWYFFNSILPNAKTDVTIPKEEYVYVDSGVNLNGEQLYKKVKVG